MHGFTRQEAVTFKVFAQQPLSRERSFTSKVFLDSNSTADVTHFKVARNAASSRMGNLRSISALAFATTTSIILSAFQGSYRPVFSAQERIAKPETKTNCKTWLNAHKPADESFEQQYERVWQLAAQNFLYEERLRNFDNWRDKYKGKLHTPGDFDTACTAMLDYLNDEYTFFRDVHCTGERKSESSAHNVVSTKTFKNSIGYIKIRTFSARACVEETRSALKQFASQRAIILDLRDNWGGSIDDAFAIFQMLVDSGGFVKMVGREDAVGYTETLSVEPQQAVKARDGDLVVLSRETCIAAHTPILVLVNGESKSAAEMLAGALKDNGRAALIGEKTFGKGVVQQVWEFDNGTSVKITSARFFRPSGLPIQGVGLAPDVKVHVSRASDAQLQRAIQLAFNNARKHIAYKILPLEKRPQHQALRRTTSPSAIGHAASGNR